MTPAEARPLIEGALASYYAFHAANGCIAWPNVPFTPPPLVGGFFAGGSPFWIKVDFLWGDYAMWTKGGAGGLSHTVGVLQLMFFTPLDLGDQYAYLGGDGARVLLNRLHLGTESPNDIQFLAPSGPRLSVEESWRVATVSAPFSFEESL